MDEKYLGILELEDGTYYYIHKVGNVMIAGSCTNVGMLAELTMEYDEDLSEDANLELLYTELEVKHIADKMKENDIEVMGAIQGNSMVLGKC